MANFPHYDKNSKREFERAVYSLSKDLAKTSLEIGAIKLKPNEPFQWASGYMMPIYNDNRLLLSDFKYRSLVNSLFVQMIACEDIRKIDSIAGTSTSGIPPATRLADTFSLPLIYIRDKPKAHGLKNQIEGIADNKDLEGKKVLLIEDLVSTGTSSVKTVQAIRNANGNIENCMSIFNYGFDVAADMFAGKEPYDNEGNKLSSPCKITSALKYETLLDVAKQMKYLNESQIKILEEWRADPFNWGEKHGFPKVEKK